MRHTDVISPVLPAPVSRRLGKRSRLAPLRARLGSIWLNRQLADGVEPWRTPVYAARARQLTSHRNRRMLAGALDRIVAQAERPPRPYRGPAVHPSSKQVHEARPLMLILAARLRSAAPVDPRGVAALHELLADGAGPIYRYGDPEMLRRRLEEIEAWLHALD